MVPKLSICIPTYNRAQQLEACLRAITAQAAELPAGELDILISDNASRDGTKALARRFADSHPFIKYFRWDTNTGSRHNVLSLPPKARGKFCWIFGDDDIAKSGALRKVFRLLNSRPDTALFYINYENDVDGSAPVRLAEDLSFASGREYIDYGLKHFSPDDWDSLKFTFLTSLIFRTEYWLAVPDREKFEERASPNAFVVLSLIKDRPVYLAAEPLIIQKTGSFNYQEGRHNSLNLYRDWARTYNFIGGLYCRRLPFFLLSLRLYYVTAKERLKSEFPLIKKMLDALRRTTGGAHAVC
ncbi:MAG: glycosyltransferase family 2 protein [Elusimicrobiales bacterium]|nr:glycosyltransferase family 2 protein [Elusimicrobiales bacterium]